MLITFETGITGLTPGYKILNADKSQYQARTTAGITDLGGGTYAVTVADATLAGRTVLWDTGETPARYATESFPSEAKLDAVLLKTNTIGGAGAIAWPYTLTTPDGTPIPDAEVWVKTYDPATGLSGETVIASGHTDNFGALHPVPHLDAGTYGFWAKKSGVNFSSPDIEVVV